MPYTHHPAPGHEVVWRAQGDYLQFAYHLWLFTETLAGRVPPLSNPYEFAVGGPPQRVFTPFIPLSLLYAVVAPLGMITAYNALVLLTFPLTGWATMAWLGRLGAHPVAAFLGGALAACAPYRRASLLGGHPTGFALFLIPLLLWLVEELLRRRRWRWGVAAGAVLVCLPLVEPHLFYLVGLLLPLYLLLRLWPSLPALGQAVRSLGLRQVRLGLLGLIPGLVLIPRLGSDLAVGLSPLLLLAVSVTLVLLIWWASVPVMGAGLGSAGPEAGRQSLLALTPLLLLLLPWLSVLSPIPRLGVIGVTLTGLGLLAAYARPLWNLRSRWRSWCLLLLPLLVAGGLALAWMLHVKVTTLDQSIVREGRGLQEIRLFAPRLDDLWRRANPEGVRAIYPGVVAVGLGLLALVLGRRSGAWDRRLVRFFAWLFPLAVLLSLGPAALPLPLYELAHRFLPYWSFMRQPAKLQGIAVFALAALVAVGVGALREYVRPAWRPFLAGGLLLALLLDYAPARPAGLSHLTRGEPIYAKIREEAGAGPILYLPIWPGESSWSSVYLYATTLIRHPMVNGYAPAVPADYPATIYRPLDPMNFGEVREEQYALLRRLGVRAVVFDRGVFPPKVTGFPSALTLENLRASPFLEFVGTENPFWLFRVRGQPAGLPTLKRTSPQGIFFEAEWLPRRTGRVEENADASGGRTLRAEAGRDEPGFLHFGPYRPLPTGRYIAVFRMRGESRGAGPLARVEVTADRGQRVLAQRLLPSLSPGFHDVELHFEVTRPEAVEYRLEWFGQGRLEADYVYVRFEGEEDPRETFEVEALAHAMEERADPEASGGIAAFAVLRSPRDHLLSGPYRRYPAGDYQVTFRLKVAGESRAPVMRLSVALMPHRLVLSRTDVKGTPVGLDHYREVTLLPFRLERPGVIEFLAEYFGPVPVGLDRITVTPR